MTISYTSVVKTEFEEIWSEINYTDHYDEDKITFYFLGDNSLVPLSLNEIIEKKDDMLKVNRYNQEMGEEYISWIPTYRIYVITYKEQIILDRRQGYQGYKNMQVKF